MNPEIRSNRPFVIVAIFLVVGIALLVRLLDLQVLDDKWKLSAENNGRFEILTKFP